MSDSVHYDLEMKDGPTVSVRVIFHDAKESEKFSAVLKDFAQAHSIAESSLRDIPYTPATATNQFKMIPMYKNSAILISSFCVFTPEDSYGQSRISVLRRDFSTVDFKRLADDFLGRFRQSFSNQVEAGFVGE